MDRVNFSGKRKMVHQNGVDHISELPDPLLIHIISLLDNMKDSVKTDLLSKRWKSLWTNLDTLVFHWDINNPSDMQVQRFKIFVDHTLRQCDSPKIKKFAVTGIEFDIDVPFHLRYLTNNWLEYAVNKNVQIVKLGLKGLGYEMPACFFRNSSFVSLEIDMHSLGLIPFDMNWNTLRSLSLKSLFLDDYQLEKILSGCPVLETLILDHVGGTLWKSNITSPSVRELKVRNLVHCCDFPIDFPIDSIIHIIAPRVEKLEVSGNFQGIRCNLVSVPSLKSASLTLSYMTIEYRVHGHSESDGYEEPKDMWCQMIDSLLKPVCNVDELVVGAELLQALSLSKLLDGKPLILNCKSVTLQSPICIHEVPGIISLLEFSPYLDTLNIKLMPWQCHFSTYVNVDDNCYTTYMENAFSLFNGIEFLSEQKAKLKCLKNMKIDCTEKMYSSDEDQSSKDMCYELKVVAYIVKNAPIIEKLVISSSRSDCGDFAKRYIELLSSEGDIGDKATRWDLKERKFTCEFSVRGGL